VRVIERTTPLAAVAAALTTLACCLPLSFLGAGLAGAIAWTGSYRAWFLSLTAALLILGLVQIYRGRKQCRKRSHLSVALFWTSVVLVVAIVFFPQVIASLLAGLG
jgi:cytochrome bd-type quinol oxidase subunit 2